MGTVNDELDRIAALDKEMLVPTRMRQEANAR